MRRPWIPLSLLIVALLLGVAILTVQAVLTTDWPRRYVLRQLQQRAGLFVEASALRTNWAGTTELTGVRLRRAPKQQVLLAAPRIVVRHTRLLPLLLGRPLRIHRLDLHEPSADVRQQPDGRWNWALALQALPQDSQPDATPWPSLRVWRGSVQITPSDEAAMAVGGLYVSAEHTGGLYGFRASAAEPRLGAEGWLTPDRASPSVSAPRNMKLQFRADDWRPDWSLPGSDVAVDRVSGSADLHIDFATASARGPVNAVLSLVANDQPLGQLELDARFDRRALRLTAQGSLLGHFAADGTAFLDDWSASRLALTWDGVNLDDLSRRLRLPLPLSGTASTRLLLAPAKDPRAPGPMRLRATLEVREAALRGLALEGGHVVAYLDGQRIVVDRGRLGVGGGTLRFWGRLTPRLAAHSYYLSADLQNVQLEPAVHLFAPAADVGQGQLSGRIRLMGQTTGLDTLGGSAELQLANAQMLGNDVFGVVFRALNLQFSDALLRGSGSVTARIDGGTIVVEQLRYDNQGLHLLMSGQIQQPQLGAGAKLDGFAFATRQPLANIAPLQFVNTALAALQSGVSAVRVTGTLRQPRATPASLDVVRKGSALSGARS